MNYTNRNAKSDVTGKQIAVAYVGATGGAVAAAAGMNLLVEVSGGKESVGTLLYMVWPAAESSGYCPQVGAICGGGCC